MDEHVDSMSNAYQKYVDATIAVLAEYNSASGLRTEATDLALEKFKEQHEYFLSTCDNAEVFVDTMTQQVRALEVAHHNNAVAELVHVRPAFACPRERLCPLLKMQELETDARFGDAADMSEEHDTATSTQTLTNLDLNKPSPRETVEHYIAAPQVRSNLDLNKTA
ncbi:hypothetical protein LUZ63_009163 [Rhynchospora breviuscula]|uniref:Uncharacterized protein n=1 Tax=Rhynchospora breviuscula TaxID=2022672 RepID=A0A9Q0CEV3_9POAL|nr:hypothetical protein LUZ63_009163 [Rhynchospora breviuscula]